jgi:hypothetical protein
MKKMFKMSVVMIMAVVLSFSSMINAAAVSTRETDVAKANEGNVLVTVSGKFSGDLEKAVKLINKYRKEACNNHYINPHTGKKLKKKDVDEDVAFDVLSIVPTPKVLEGKQFRYRMGNVMKVLYEHAKTKEISYENIIESVIPVEYASQVISFNLLERLSRTQNFNDSQKKFNAQVTEWVFTTMESMDRSSIEAILKTYVDIRKRDLANNNDADRRFLLKSVPEDEFPNLKKVINNYMETHQDDVKFF